jgi:hypothetical protein
LDQVGAIVNGATRGGGENAGRTVTVRSHISVSVIGVSLVCLPVPLYGFYYATGGTPDH